ncbi:MAG: hypothetical protein ABSB73_09720 [Solirubrobacteraceae bacterium]
MTAAGWVGHCESCGQDRDLALAPGSSRRVCVDCYVAARVDRPPTATGEEIELAARFARDWAALQAAGKRPTKAPARR